MTNVTRGLGIAAVGLLLTGTAGAAGQADASGAHDKSTAILSVQTSTRSASAPLEMRVSVQFVNSKAADMMQVLAKAAGLSVEVPSTPLHPVTVTLTNVRLKTALDAICDTAACNWRIDGTTIKVTAVGGGTAATSALPPTVSIELEQVPVRDVFRAIGATINVPVTVEGNVERPPLTVTFTNAPTQVVLDFICKNAGCRWEFDGTSLRVRFKTP